MAAKSADQVYGAENRAGGTVMMFDPEKLVVITDEKHPMYDDRVTPNASPEVLLTAIGRLINAERQEVPNC